MTSHDRRMKGPIPEFVTRYSSMESARRKHNLEGGPSADVAFDYDPPAVGLDQMPGNGETQSSASGLEGARCIDAVEALENPLLLCLGDADSSVGDSDRDLAVAGRCLDRNPPARRRVLHGVVKKVLEHLLQPARIAHNARQPWRAVHRKGNVFVSNFQPGCFHSGLDHLLNCHCAEFQLQLSGLGL